MFGSKFKLCLLFSSDLLPGFVFSPPHLPTPSKLMGNNPDMLYYLIFQKYRSPLGKSNWIKNSKMYIPSLHSFWKSWLTTHGSQNWSRFTQNLRMMVYGNKSLMIPEWICTIFLGPGEDISFIWAFLHYSISMYIYAFLYKSFLDGGKVKLFRSITPPLPFPPLSPGHIRKHWKHLVYIL